MDLTRKDWPAGWLPSQSIHGDPRGLLRADNLVQDENGALVLCQAPNKIAGPFNSFVDQIYSRYIDGRMVRYVGVDNEASRIMAIVGTNAPQEIVSGEGKTCFGSSLGWVYCSAGNNRVKNNGTETHVLGLTTPVFSPAIVSINQDSISPVNDFSNWVHIEGKEALYGSDPWILEDLWGTPYATDFSATANQVLDLTNETTFKVIYGAVTSRTDLLTFNGGPSPNPDDDIFELRVNFDDPSKIERVRVEFLLEGDVNYYVYEFENFDGGNQYTQFRIGANAESILTCQRSDFERIGTDPNHDWGKMVTGVRIGFVCRGNAICATSGIKFIGGKNGQLAGTYEYVQVNIADNGRYQAKSPYGPISERASVINGSVNIAPNITDLDEQVNKIWIYRRAIIDSDSPYAMGLLDKFYRVLITDTSGATVIDNTSDISAIQENVTLNESLLSVRDIDDTFYDIEGIYYERMIYMGKQFIYLSDKLNPDAIDTRYTLKASGDPVERNLWLRKVTNGVILLGTTKDIYEITGTLADLPDGTLDILIRPIGETYPPICGNRAVFEGAVYYMAADGVRYTGGSNSVLISWQLNKLFRESRYGVEKILVLPDNQVKYPLCVGRSKLYWAPPLIDGTGYVFVYDFILKSWTLRFTDPVAFFTEEDDNILAGYGGGAGNFLRNFEDGYLVDGSLGQSILLQTVFDDNNQPRNRKDTFTLKICADTGGEDVQIYISKNDNLSDYYLLGVHNSSGPGISYWDINHSDLSLGFRYSLKLVGESLTTFRFYNFTIEYDPRPEQLNHLNLQPNNLGSPSRKRFINYAFVIDTLGNGITFTPYIDGVAGSPEVINTSAKQTYIYYFTQETVGTDISGVLDGGTFEYYNIDLDETISEKMPSPAKYFFIPMNDYGSPNRKRHSSYKFQINTRGGLCKFRPWIDGLPAGDWLYFINSGKKTVEYFFGADTSGIEIGGEIASDPIWDRPFEFYGTIVPQEIEQFPSRLTEFRIPENNLGLAAKKRVRTLPLYINTNGNDVTFTPIVDGVALAPSIINTPSKTTAFHYFDTDVFGVDFSGELTSHVGHSIPDDFDPPRPFEFYGLLKPEDVEMLPVAKKFDQIGPVRYDKLAKLYAFRVRLITPDREIPLKIYNEDQVTDPQYPATPSYEGTIKTIPNTDYVYQVILPKNINGDIFRIVLGGSTSSPFHRYQKETFLKVSLSGMETDAKWEVA